MRWVLTIVAALGLSGCMTLAEFQRDADLVIAAYHRGEVIGESVVRQTVATTCGTALPIASARSMDWIAKNPTSPRVPTINRYLNSAAAACNAYYADASGSGLFGVAMALFDAYKAWQVTFRAAGGT